MSKRASGGARATQRKHDERATRRRRAKWNEKSWLAKYSALEQPPAVLEEAHEWIGRVALLMMAEAMTDPGPTAEARREQIIRALGQISKVLQPAVLSEKLRQYKRVLAELKKKHAASVGTGADGRARPGAALS